MLASVIGGKSAGTVEVNVGLQAGLIFTSAARARNFSFQKRRSMLLLTEEEEASDELKPLTFSQGT
jgi:hypothetical protein